MMQRIFPIQNSATWLWVLGISIGILADLRMAEMAFAQENPSINVPRSQVKPLKVGVVGLVHTHVHWILGRKPAGDIEIVGIVEPNRELAKRYSQQHGYSMDIVFDSLEEMVAATKPEAVTAFNTIQGHLEVVQFCAPRGIHVMVEKPMAVSLEHAKQMKALATQHNIQLLTNYETSWYPSTHEAYQMVHQKGKIPSIQKMNFYTGHPGPIEIGCNPEFVAWLTDPKLNGGGALTDFGCYGANLATWFLRGAAPHSVTCVTAQNKPQLYPQVEDDATLILNYVQTQVVIQASWNWAHNRKEMEVYGPRQFVRCQNDRDMIIMLNEREGAVKVQASQPTDRPRDPFEMLQRVVRNDWQLEKYDVSSMENNFRVMQILEAAKKSALEKRTVLWSEVE